MKKVTILRNHLQSGQYGGKKGDVVEIPEALADAWIKAKFAAAVDEKK